MNKLRIHILLAAYNGENFIERQINSIIQQSIKFTQLIISIDKSNDNTSKIIKNFSNEYHGIKTLNSNESYGSAASNFINLLRNVDLKDVGYIALSDQDDIWKEDKLEKAIKKLGQGYDGYSSNVEAFWEVGRKKVLVKNQPQQEFDHLFESAGPGCTFVLTKRLALSLQEFLKGELFDQLGNYHDWLI